MDYPHENPRPLWKANRRWSSVRQGRIPPCVIELSIAGGLTRVSYDTIWNVAIRLVGQCPALGRIAPAARTQRREVWTVAITSPRSLDEQVNHNNDKTVIG